MTNVVDLTIMPISNDELSFYESMPYLDSNGRERRDLNMTLLKPSSDLYAFGIFGRDFEKDLGPWPTL